MLPVLLIALLLSLLLLGIGNSLLFALLHLLGWHSWDKAKVGIRLTGYIAMLRRSVLLSFLLRLLIEGLREILLYG